MESGLEAIRLLSYIPRGVHMHLDGNTQSVAKQNSEVERTGKVPRNKIERYSISRIVDEDCRVTPAKKLVHLSRCEPGGNTVSLCPTFRSHQNG